MAKKRAFRSKNSAAGCIGLLVLLGGVFLIGPLFGGHPPVQATAIAVPRAAAPPSVEPVVLEPADIASPTPKASAMPSPTRLTASQLPSPSATAKRGAVAGTNANLRAGPGTNYPLVGGVQAGQALQIVGCNPEKTWYQLQGAAWIFGGLVQDGACPLIVQNIAPPPPAGTPVRPTAAPIVVTEPSPTFTLAPAQAYPTQPPAPARSCCKVCSGGKACGDSCIARNKTCHKGQGCACDG